MSQMSFSFKIHFAKNSLGEIFVSQIDLIFAFFAGLEIFETGFEIESLFYSKVFSDSMKIY